MAKKLKSGDAPLLNSEGRIERINSYFAERYDMDRAIEAARQRHIAPLMEERSELNKTFRADLDMTEADIRGQYITFKRRRDLELLDDDGERNKRINNMQELYDAVYDEKGQLGWLAAFEKVQAEKEGDAGIEAARVAGFEAGYNGQGPEANPFQPGEMADTWDRSHESGEKQRKVDAGKKARKGKAKPTRVDEPEASFGDQA